MQLLNEGRFTLWQIGSKKKLYKHHIIYYLRIPVTTLWFMFSKSEDVLIFSIYLKSMGGPHELYCRKRD